MKVMLKEVRNSRGLSQNQLARAIDMTPQYIQKIEYGKIKSVPLDTLNKLCRILKCEAGDLLVYVPDDDESQESNLKQDQLPQLKEGGEAIENNPSRRHQRTRSFLTVVPKVPESA